MSPPPGAAARVFALPELLDMILLEVSDCLQIFVLRRTNSTFNDTVSGCKSLRRRIFLEHSPGRTYNDVNEFLGQAPLKHATAPFDFLTLDTGFHCILCEELNPEHSFSVRDQLFPRRRLKSSWRDILVGLPESSVLIELGWQDRTTPFRATINASTTLGEVVAVAEKMAVNSWSDRGRGTVDEKRRWVRSVWSR